MSQSNVVIGKSVNYTQHKASHPLGGFLSIAITENKSNKGNSPSLFLVLLDGGGMDIGL
jgi:hypothetical protein